MRSCSFILIIFISACSGNSQKSNKYQQQFFVAREFIKKLKNDDSAGVKGLIGVDLSDISKNEEILSFEVKQLSHLLNSHILPDERTYRVIEYQKNDAQLLDIVIPIGTDSLEIGFAKFLPVDKIWGYNWHRVDIDNNLITLPLDSIKD